MELQAQQWLEMLEGASSGAGVSVRSMDASTLSLAFPDVHLPPGTAGLQVRASTAGS